jgi:hypothetical protein
MAEKPGSSGPGCKAQNQVLDGKIHYLIFYLLFTEIS